MVNLSCGETELPTMLPVNCSSAYPENTDYRVMKDVDYVIYSDTSCYGEKVIA